MDFSGFDISVCVNEVLFEPVRKTWAAKFFREYLMECGSLVSLMKKELLTLASRNLMHKDLLQSRGRAEILSPAITRADFDKILAKQKPTVSKADLEVHERFTQEFGEEG
ncbi:hypothetical protein L6164_008692 [Bauhinia variegata]|uniref:Uncharacterized protein n=1 Tax=Bauhinia variegata TaxID=167791 RepID=A0ACB9PIZ1_BAUVA|nr:hypothetical protein L6164_008692 [Bauhinia variegata]